MIGKQGKNGIHTEYERASGLIKMKELEYLTSKSTIKAQKEMFLLIDKKLRKSTTLDKGNENMKYNELKELGMNTYFADPLAGTL